MNIKIFQSSERGFTLVELAIVMLIFGLSLLFISRFVSLYTLNAQLEKTEETIRLTDSAMNEFFGLQGRYPCPADPDLAPGDINYGVEQCRNFTDPGFDPNSCAGTPGGISCTTVGSRDGDLNGSPDVVMIGSVPFRTLLDVVTFTDFTETNAFDGFGRQLTYAVTEPMSDTRFTLVNPANTNAGAISVIDENRIPLTEPDATAHYIIISHGQNGRGAYSREGVEVDNCLVTSLPASPGVPSPVPPGVNPAGIEIEIENCDRNDAIFAKAIQSGGDNDFFNDDTSSFTTRGLTTLWRRSLSSPSGEAHIYNTNTGNVGIGIQNPLHRLHIVGDLSSEQKVIGQRYCEGPNEENCLDVNRIAGDGTECPPGEAAYAIGYDPNDPNPADASPDPMLDAAKLHCKPVNWITQNLTCPDHNFGGGLQQTFLNGFSNLGNIVCCRENPLVQEHCIRWDGTTATTL